MEGKISMFFKGLKEEKPDTETAEHKMMIALKKGSKNRVWDRESLPEFLAKKREMVLF